MAEVAAALEPAVKRPRIAAEGSTSPDYSHMTGSLSKSSCSSRSRACSDSTQSTSTGSPLQSMALWPTPPVSPAAVGPLLEDLPLKLLATIFSQSRLDAVDRLRLQLCSRRVKRAVDCAYGAVRRLRVANAESEDDRLSSVFILRSIKKCSNLRTLTLCLSSSVNEDLCTGPQLFQVLAKHCPVLSELTLLLTQLRLVCLNEGLIVLGQQMHQRQRVLRKLCLVNSVADGTTIRVLAQWHHGLESVGLLNCWYVTDQLLAYLASRLSRLRTLNVSATRQVTRVGVQQVINQCALRQQHIKLYLSNCSARPDQLLYEDGCVAVCNPQRAARRKRMRDGRLVGVDLADDAVRAEWGEYDSACDFD